MKINLKKSFSLLLTLSFLLPMFCTTGVSAEESDKKIVRVGYYQSTNFQEGMADGAPKSGYGYEYLQKVSDYNNWDYEYVYGGWTDLLEMLENGEIDIMGGVSITEDRKATLAYPDYKMGSEEYYLYQNEENPTMNTGDLSSIQGKRIGAITNNLFTDDFEDWAEENAVSVDLHYYETFAERDDALRSGEIDGLIAPSNNINITDHLSPVVKVGESPFYLAVTKERPDLLADLNTALGRIQSLEPYLLENLQYKNYCSTVANCTLSDAETEWISNHSSLEIGYLNDYLPYCDTDEKGKATGLMVDVMDAILKQLDLSDQMEVHYHGYDSYKEMLGGLQQGEIDMVFPTSGNIWEMEQSNIDVSSFVVSSGMELVYYGSYDKKTTDTIAINENNDIQRIYAQNEFPDAELVSCDSMEECLTAVLNGSANCTILDSLRNDIVIKNEKYSNFSVVQLTATDGICFGIPSGNYPLLMLINRGINVIGHDYAINASYAYMDELYSYSTSDFLRLHYKNVLFVILAAFIIIVGLSFIVIYHLHAEKEKQNVYLRKLENAKRDTNDAKKESTTDNMTGLLNRRAYEQELQDYEEHGISDTFTLVSLDLNGLKNANDNLGHEAGDELIKGAARCIKVAFSFSKKIYRVGGDEFVVLGETPLANLEKSVQQLREICHIWSGDMVKKLEIACGYATHEEFPTESLKDLERIADHRMYEDKSLYYKNRQDRRGDRFDASVVLLQNCETALKVDLQSDSYQIYHLQESDKNIDFPNHFSNWLKKFAILEALSPKDLEAYQQVMNPEYLQNHFQNSNAPIRFHYTKVVHEKPIEMLLEITPAVEYTLENPVLFLFVQQIDSCL